MRILPVVLLVMSVAVFSALAGGATTEPPAEPVRPVVTSPAPPPPPSAPPTAAAPEKAPDVNAIIGEYNEKVTAASRAGQDISKVMPRFADEGMAQLDASKLTLEQYEALISSALLRYATKTGPAMERLDQLCEQTGIAGARAAIIRMSIVASVSDPEQQKKIIETALKHPAYGDALKSGLAREGINCTQAVPYSMVKYTTRLVADLADVLPDELDPIMSWQTSYLMDLVMNVRMEPPLEPEKVEKLRAKCVKIQKNALAKIEAQAASQPQLALAQLDNRKRLAGNIAYLEGAFARGQLVGHEAPEIPFAWCSTEPKLNKLSDLKGKIVVLDFWATWCGPCRMSIPRVAKLVEYYKDKPVVVVGITHPQGFHIDAANKRTETPSQDQEFALMGQFVKDMQITWPQVFAPDGRTNAEYGVRTIPHMVIIDATGKVRNRGLNPLVPIEEKTAIIDALLAEMPAK